MMLAAYLNFKFAAISEFTKSITYVHKISKFIFPGWNFYLSNFRPNSLEPLYHQNHHKIYEQ